MKTMQVSKIVLIIDYDFNARVLELLPRCGILDFYSSVGRQNHLRKAIKFPNPFADGYTLSTHRSDIFRFYVPREYEKHILNYISEQLTLKTAGNGSIFAENAEIIVSEHKLFDEEQLKKLPQTKETNLFSYHLVTAIVNRGTADFVSKNILKMGFGVPAVCFGEGMGLRHKLGLLRIVIPSDKEIMLVVVPPSSTGSLVETIRKSAQLDSSGKGVIFVEKVRAMNVNIRIYHDMQQHAATMDQIITSIDIIHGSTEWRARTRAGKHFSGEVQKYCNFVLISEEDSLADSVQAALAAGVGGATSVDYNGHFFDTEEQELHSFQTKEGCEMVAKEYKRSNIEKAIEESNFYGDICKGILEITDVNYFFA
jgi:nitrogen regulatory protein PII